MTAVGWLARRQLRRRWPALLPVVGVVALGTTAALVAAGAADRTGGGGHGGGRAHGGGAGGGRPARAASRIDPATVLRSE